MIEKKHILMIDAFVLVVTFGIVVFVVGYTQPLIIAPIDDYTTSDTSVLFEFENADRILIDDNIDFDSPLEFEVSDDVIISLDIGVYYWKLEGQKESEIRKITIESKVDLQIKEKEEGNYEIVNAGNKRLNVDIYEDGSLTGSVILERFESEEAKGDKFIGGQDE